MYGVVRLPPAVVEPLIAASIAFVAVENLCTTELKPWRPFVVFGFGLVHGLGFAGVLCCYVGVFLMMPLGFASTAVAYKQVFGLALPKPVYQVPPPPPTFK